MNAESCVFGEPSSEGMTNVFYYLYHPLHKDVNYFQIVTPFTVIKRVNRSLVLYDKSIAKQKIKQNKERYKTLAMNRRLQTKRVRTHFRK